MNNTTRTTLSAIAIATAVGLGTTALATAATPSMQQMAPTSDHSSSTGQAVNDAWITTKVKSELATTKGVKSADVSVKTVDGVVTLTGVLPTEIAVNKAIAVAKSVRGVTGVDAAGLKAQS